MNKDAQRLPGELSGHPVELTAESAVRRLQLIGKRLAVPVADQPGEGLPDLYVRAISRNGEEFSSTLWPRLAGAPKAYFSHRNFVDLSVDDDAFSAFLGTPNGATDIAPLRYVRLRKGTVTFFGTQLRLSSLSPHRRVSPRFLASHGYQKAIWAVSSLAFDPANREHLLERCPVCGEMLSFQRIRGLYHCHRCVNDEGQAIIDFRDFPQPLVEMESYENIDLACSLIDPQQNVDHWELFHSDLRSLERGQLFEFIVLLARLLDAVPGGPLDGPVSPNSLHEATEAIKRWPQGLVEIGEKVRDVWKRSSYKRGRSFLHPVSREVAALSAFFGSDFSKVVKNQLRAGLRAGESDVVEGAPQRISRFRRSHPRTKKRGGFDINDPTESFAFAMLLARESQLVRSEAKKAGLPLVELLKLYDSGTVRCPDDHLKRYLATVSEEDDFMGRINAVSRDLSGQGWLLTDAVFAFADGRLCWTNVITEVFEGNLPVSLCDGDGPVFRRLFVDDLAKLSIICRACPADKCADDLVLSNHDVGFYLSIIDTEVARLVTSGFLPANGINLAAVRKFQSTYVNPSEILKFLRVREHYTRSIALIFSKMLAAGVEPVHRNPSTRERKLVQAYFRTLGY
ncbi:hypothetical protein ACCS55_09690 [Rhizobium ruizarguesonis]